jgi:hypothetical protein
MYEENYSLARDGYKGSFFPYIFFGLSGYVFLILFYGDRFFPSLAIPIKIFFAMTRIEHVRRWMCSLL